MKLEICITTENGSPMKKTNFFHISISGHTNDYDA